ncbi:MAG: hypothetical protein ACM3X4_06140 [Ignavibacteriales bacterium]
MTITTKINATHIPGGYDLESLNDTGSIMKWFNVPVAVKKVWVDVYVANLASPGTQEFTLYMKWDPSETTWRRQNDLYASGPTRLE